MRRRPRPPEDGSLDSGPNTRGTARSAAATIASTIRSLRRLGAALPRSGPTPPTPCSGDRRPRAREGSSGTPWRAVPRVYASWHHPDPRLRERLGKRSSRLRLERRTEDSARRVRIAPPDARPGIADDRGCDRGGIVWRDDPIGRRPQGHTDRERACPGPFGGNQPDVLQVDRRLLPAASFVCPVVGEDRDKLEEGSWKVGARDG